jgi:hypothetical protein
VLLEYLTSIISCRALLRKEHNKLITHSNLKSIRNPRISKEIDLHKMYFMKRPSDEKQNFNKKRKKSTSSMRNR